MVDFEAIPNKDKAELMKAIAEQIQEYFQGPVNTEKHPTRNKKQSA